jgi:hypothetical protein
LSEGRVIELDARWDLLESPEPPRLRARMRLRGLVAMVVAVLCLATMGAAARPPVPSLSLLGLVKRPNSGAPLQLTEMRLTGGMLLAQTGGTLVALEPDGRRRWTVQIDMAQESYLDYWMSQGILLVERYEAIRYSDGVFGGPSTTSIGLDPATGAERWRTAGSVMAADDVLIVEDGMHPHRIYRSLPSDLLWTMPEVLAWELDVEHHAIYAITPDGMFTEYDLHTGAVRASGKVDVPRIPDGQPSPLDGYPDQVSLQVFEDRIVLRAQRFGEFGTPSEILVYDRMTLRPMPASSEGFGSAIDCGPVLCAIDGEQVSVLDKAEHVELWQPQLGEYPSWTGSYLMIWPRSGIHESTVVDPRTGRVLQRLEGWTPVEERVRPADGKRFWMTRFTPPRYTEVAVLEDTGPRVIGSMPFEVTGCGLEGDLLACAIADGRVGVWRVNAS